MLEKKSFFIYNIYINYTPIYIMEYNGVTGIRPVYASITKRKVEQNAEIICLNVMKRQQHNKE